MRFLYNKDMDENLDWLTQNTEDPESNKGNVTFPTHTVKKVATPLFYINPPPTPPLQVYPSFLAKNFQLCVFIVYFEHIK